jgi:hypothetical protein
MDQPRAVHPIYRPSEGNEIVVYAGELRLSRDGAAHDVSGDLVLRLGSRPGFSARVAGTQPWLADGNWQVEVPAGTPIHPPTASALPAEPADAEFWTSDSIPIDYLTAGDLGLAECFVVHVSGPLTSFSLPRTDGGRGQGQLSITLPDWDLRLAAVDREAGAEDFSFVINATPHTRPVDADAVQRLRQRLFTLLSFVAGQQIGVMPIVGLDGDGQLVWAEWGSPRFDGFEQRTWRWCPTHTVSQVLPTLAQAVCELANVPALEKVFDRAVNYLLVANGPGFLDVRIPVACSGLELLGWAVLQREQWLTTDAFGKLTAGHVAQLLCQWAGIPVDLPDHYAALRRRPTGQQDWAGPDIVFKVRNDLVHPPRKLDDPAWPTHEALFQACQLTTWYLELAILRLLDYKGGYRSRLDLDRPAAGNIAPVVPTPWTTSIG